MTSRTLSLDGAWRLGRVPQQPLAFRGDDRAAVTEWLPATVPGHVHADLMRAGRLPDLYCAEGVAQAAWVDAWDWWLERVVTLARRPDERLFLHFDAIDYLATLWLDDHRLARHEGAFHRHTLELTPLLPADGSPCPYRVGVRLWGAGAWPAPDWRPWERAWAALARRLLPGKASLRPFHPRLRWLRAPMQAGWDFAPRLPAIGLWEGVWIEVTRGVRLDDFRFSISDFRGATARAAVTLSLNARAATGATVRVAWAPDNFDGQGGETAARVTLRAGTTPVRVPLVIEGARRWHPWEQGSPHLYRLTVTVETAGGPSASHTTRVGIRDVRWDGPRLVVNGQPFFARGVNWVPADLLLATVPRERYAWLLGLARGAGVNLLRVWGGGGRERRLFYDLCDELGLLVWQEFPFACAFLDHYPRDAEFLALAEQTARGTVRALRDHPSLAWWGAGNEFSRGRNRPLLRCLARAVEQEDTRPLRPPSPGPGDRHNWHVWHGRAPLHTLDDETVPWLSEVGVQAPPAPGSLRRFLPPDALWPPGEAWEQHHAELAKLFTYTLPGSDLFAFVAASQRAQALAVQVAVERQRRRRAAGAAGIVLWQWNEPWPAISWALVDYFGVPKAAAWWLRHGYAPLLLSLDVDWRVAGRDGGPLRATLWAINDLAQRFDGCEARLRQRGETLWATPLALPPHSARPVADLVRALPDPHAPLDVELWQGDHCLARNRYEFPLPGPRRTPLVAALYRTLAEWIMRW